MQIKIVKSVLLSVLVLPFFMNAQVNVDAESLPPDSINYIKRTVYLSDNAKSGRLDKFVDSLVQSFMQSPQNCGISIGISQNGKSYFYNYGEITRDTKVLPSRTTLYEIGSLTPAFCGKLLALAVAEKKIGLEDDIRLYLPGKFETLVYNKFPIKVKHLINHTSGLPQRPVDLTLQENFDPADPYKNYSREQIFMYLQRVKLTTEPGAAYDYSSLGVALLGILLEGIYKMPFEMLVKEKICIPKQMLNTGIQLTELQRQNFASGYTDEGISTPHWNLNAFSAAGGLRSCTNDMLIFLDSQAEEKSVFSWSVKKTKQGNTLFYQNGGTYGSAGFSGFIKEKKCSLILLTNSGRNIDYIAIALFNYLQQ